MQAQRALALAEAGQLASRMSREFVNSLEEVFQRIAKPANYDRWALVLVNDAHTRLERITAQLSPEFESALERAAMLDLESDFSPLVQVFKNQRVLVINNPSNFPGPQGVASASPDVFGKTVMTPVQLADEVVGVLMLGRSLNAPNLADSDEQLAVTLAAQVSIALENQRLLRAAESERERLGSILASLPAGVLVLDPLTYKPIQFNNQIEQLLGRAIVLDQPFDVNTYHVYRSGTDAPYPFESLPIFAVTAARQLVAADDIAIIHDDGSEVDLLMNAVPIMNEDGSISAIVAAFQDISTLRNLERTLESNLRDTVALYETTRSLAVAEEIDDVLDEVFGQLTIQNATSAYVLLADPHSGVQVVRSLSGSLGDWTLPLAVLDLQDAIYISDVTSEGNLEQDERAALLDAAVAALVTIPLRARSRRDVPLGWLVIGYDQPLEFAQETEQFLNALGDSAAVALDNRYLLQSTEQALQDTAALYGATTNLSRARSQDEIATAMQGAFESLALDFYAGYLLVEDQLTELFNVSLDADPLDFIALIARYNLLNSETHFVADLRDLTAPEPFERALLELGNVRSYALMILRSQDVPIGCFMLANHTPHNFSGGDERYLGSVADSASVVVNNYLLLDQIQGSLEETSVLYQASRALNDASSPAEILNVIVSHLSNRPISQIFIALLSGDTWDHPKAMAQVVATWQREGETGIDLAGINLVAEQYPAWRLLASPNVLTIDDISESEELDLMERIGVESLELRSICVLPLRIAGRSIGAFVIGGRTPYHHTERDLRIYGSLSEQASLRMEAVRLLAQTERRARQLTTSSEVSQIASSILDLNDLLPRIVDLIRDSFAYDHVQIFLLDENDYATLRASTGSAGRQLLEIRHRLQKGSASVIGQVTEAGTPIIASDTADARVVHRPNPYLPNTRSEMAIPLKLQGRVVGALDVQSNLANAFDDDDIQVLTTLAAQISVAIDNAQLFDQARSRANEMSFLFDVTTAAASAETLQDAIQNVANELRNSLNALSVSVYLPQTYLNTDEETITILHPVALAGSDQPLSELSEVRLDSPNNLIADSARALRPTIVDNLDERSDYLSVVEGAHSAIIVPLAAGTQLIGLVALESGEIAAYDNDTLTLLLTLSGTLSAVIQNQQLLEQVQETNDQLRELDRLKSDFLANMSHELRTPLNSIIGFSRVILKGIDGALTEMQEQDLTTIYNSGLHLLNLINDILDQAKIAAGKMDLQIDYFEMKSVVDGVRSIGIGLVKDKPIDIFVDIAPGLPKAYGDEFRTRQVLINLVSNAAKFTREGKITLSVYPVRDEETRSTMLRIDVIDTGIGIAEKDMPLLFEAFRQVDSSLTRTQGGTGLGLPISKSLVEMQNGRMVVSSRVNAGSTFSILMPIEPPPKDEEKLKKTAPLGFDANFKTGATGPLTAQSNGQRATKEAREAEPAYESSGGPNGAPYIHVKRQILLIEDSPDMVDQYRRALQREGFDIFTASIPLEAEAMASGLHPTIIIMDVNFAGGQGWNILGKLKARDDTFDIPVIVVTLSNDQERAEEMGTFRFIGRPFSPEDLVQAVQDAERDSRIDRILIIDDQPESVRLLTQVLGEQGNYRVFSATSGADGIALVARRRPNLVILDLRMPEMDGFKVVQELRGNPETATIPILVVTGDAVSISSDERQQLTNLAVVDKGEISAEEYQQFIDGVRANLNGD
ncbi:MAG: GAF domain-containing protein, partial [Chloroflexota bacterium]